MYMNLAGCLRSAYFSMIKEVMMPDMPNAWSVQSLGMNGSSIIRLPYSQGIRLEWLTTDKSIKTIQTITFL